MLWWSVGVAVSMDTLLAPTNSPSPTYLLPSLANRRAPLRIPHANQPLPRASAGRKRGGNTPYTTPTWALPWQAAQTGAQERRRQARMWGWEGKLGGVGGAQSASLPSTCKLAPSRTLPHTIARVPMTLPQVPARNSRPFHANPHGASPSAAASWCCPRCPRAAGRSRR